MNSKNEIAYQVYNYLVAAGINSQQAKYIVSQSAHETGNFKSDVLKSNNNLFGMTYAGQPDSLGDLNGYANYTNIAQSVKDYVRYYKLKGYADLYASVPDFVKALKKAGYFTADLNEYINGVTHFNRLYYNG